LKKDGELSRDSLRFLAALETFTKEATRFQRAFEEVLEADRKLIADFSRRRRDPTFSMN
jgi:hypothetical protein